MIAESKIQFGANVFKALAHPTRLFIVERLGAVAAMCVREITDLIGDDISTVSRHLAVLKSSGILESEKVGNEVRYRLAMPCVLSFLACVDNEIESQRKRLING